MSLPVDVHLRPMTAADIEDGLRLCRASRWNQVARDWGQFLALDPRGALVACRDGRVVGSVATIRYPPDLAWVAMVLVDPSERGHGIGTALLREGLVLVKDVPVVGLDATPLGRPIYLKLGFADAFGLHRMQRPAERGRMADVASATIRRARSDDWIEICALDRAVTGVDRSLMLQWLAEGAPPYAWVSTAGPGGPLNGLVTGRRGHAFEHIGPVLATDLTVAQRLVSAVLGEVPDDRAVVIDAAEPQAGWVPWLLAMGFEAQRPFTRMYRGEAATRGCHPGLFAVIGPEFG